MTALHSFPHAATAPSILDVPHGIHADVDDAVYHQRVLGLASKSMLDEVRRSPLHYRASVGGAVVRSSPALSFGRAFHAALLEPDVFARTFVVAPDFGDCRKPANKAARDAWREEHGGKEILDEADGATVAAMVASVRAHPLASRLLAGGEPEVTVRWRDEDTGLECKARLDYFTRSRKRIVDVKTTEDARLEHFRRTVVRFGYHRQEAMYRDALEELGVDVDHFFFVAVEKTPPYAVAVFQLDSASVAKGRVSIRGDLETLADCVSRDEWPGYPAEIQTLSVPDWAE